MIERHDEFVTQQDDRGTNNNDVPRYFQVRVVGGAGQLCPLSKMKMLSCGLPARKRLPGRHIFAVVQQRHKQIMYSIRWYVLYYQHWYGRAGHEKMTEHFTVMITQEQPGSVEKMF
jgi:hypothetical protein